MPFIWLSKSKGPSPNFIPLEENAARRFVAGWTLRPGSHVQAEAKLITRRLITSSVLRDIFFKESQYDFVSLFPINEVGSSRYSNASLATAIIRTNMRPGFMHFQTQKGLQDPKLIHDSVDKCDFVDDYRSGTVFDIIGSVGGLFALLHAVHVLLFGRPLLWGLTGWSRSTVELPPPHSATYAGAKLITPFGLIGRYSSANFKSHLRREYHDAPTEDGASTIQIVKFLRDFVIDFGPAELDRNQRSSDEHMSSGLAIVNEGTISTRIPLISTESDRTESQQREDGTNGEVDASRNFMHSMA
ncbi:hypothetical protein RHS03_00286, partial [Rhizoctonia solani]